MLGVGNQYFARFQRPYSFDATSEMTVDIIEAPLVLNLASKPDVRTQLGNTNASDQSNISNQQSDDVSALVADAQTEASVKKLSKMVTAKKRRKRVWEKAVLERFNFHRMAPNSL